MSHDHDHEPDFMPGVPHRLPEGERLLWQGRQRFSSLARRAFRFRVVVAWFAAIIVGASARDVLAGAPPLAALATHQWLVLPAAVAAGILLALAWGFKRTTVYTITSERVLIRTGIALPMTIDIPLSLISNAALRKHRDGSGDIVLSLNPEERASWLMLWPSVRPLRLRHPEPMLRALAQPDAGAEALKQALLASVDGKAVADAVPSRVTPRDQSGAESGGNGRAPSREHDALGVPA